MTIAQGLTQYIVMYSLRVDSVKKDNSQSDNSDFINVTVSVFEKKSTQAEDGTTQEVDEMVEQRHLGFPLSISDDELKLELDKFLQTYTLEKKQAIDNSAREKEQANADQIIEKFSGRLITIELNERVAVDENVQQ